MNKVEIQFTTSVDRLLSFCGHAIRFELEYMSKTGYWSNFKERGLGVARGASPTLQLIAREPKLYVYCYVFQHLTTIKTV